MNVTIRQLEAFLAVAEAGSFTRAAERLRVAQPALSLSVRELERELRVRLIDRTTRRLELTRAGREFRATAHAILADLERAVRSAHDVADSKRGRLVVAAPPLLATMILPGAIADFRAQFPGIDVELIDTRTDLIISKVQIGEADCGIGTFPPETDGIKRVPLVEDSLLLFCSARHPLAARARLSWSDLKGVPLVILTRDSGIRLLVDLGFQAANASPRIAFEVSQITTAVALVERDLGVAVLPAYAWTFARFCDDVVSRPLVAPSMSREIAMITTEGRSPAPALDHFVGFVRSHARRAPRQAEPRGAGRRVPAL
jgi:DNA-binding transcriptional LysR family regulator